MQSLPPAIQMVFVTQYKGPSKFPPKADLNWIFIASDFLVYSTTSFFFTKEKLFPTSISNFLPKSLFYHHHAVNT